MWKETKRANKNFQKQNNSITNSKVGHELYNKTKAEYNKYEWRAFVKNAADDAGMRVSIREIMQDRAVIT